MSPAPCLHLLTGDSPADALWTRCAGDPATRQAPCAKRLLHPCPSRSSWRPRRLHPRPGGRHRDPRRPHGQEGHCPAVLRQRNGVSGVLYPGPGCSPAQWTGSDADNSVGGDNSTPGHFQTAHGTRNVAGSRVMSNAHSVLGKTRALRGAALPGPSSCGPHFVSQGAGTSVPQAPGSWTLTQIQPQEV